MDQTKVYIGYVAHFIQALGVLTVVGGIAFALLRFLLNRQKSDGERSYKALKQELGKAILLGLEILVAGDIISTLVTEPSLERVLALAVIVLIRTLLSLSLQVEVEGRFPWQKTPSP